MAVCEKDAGEAGSANSFARVISFDMARVYAGVGVCVGELCKESQC